ncbi:529_t:CDS:2 [Entrophospora sp. SA101]|nr:529_t:CDS:2 [Entrophospora sp. SA101]
MENDKSIPNEVYSFLKKINYPIPEDENMDEVIDSIIDRLDNTNKKKAKYHDFLVFLARYYLKENNFHANIDRTLLSRVVRNLDKSLSDAMKEKMKVYTEHSGFDVDG